MKDASSRIKLRGVAPTISIGQALRMSNSQLSETDDSIRKDSTKAKAKTDADLSPGLMTLIERAKAHKKESPKASITRMFSGSQWVDFASLSVDQKQLCGPLWYEGEICILFADTNVGKSILAVQIADMISSGEHCETALPELRPETPAQPVVYADFELSISQFGRRYSCPHPEKEGEKAYYDFGNNFHRVELYYDLNAMDDSEMYATKAFADQIIADLETRVNEVNARVLIIDNVTFMASGTETAADAMPLMKKLVALKKRHDLSILLLAHTPKRSLSSPLTRNDLQGSKMLINFADSAFAIGESSQSKDVRYIKQIKQRNCEQIYGADSVLECCIGKVYENFVGFASIGTGKESAHLAEPKSSSSGTGSKSSHEAKRESILQLKQEGYKPAEIAELLSISVATVYRLL